MTLLPSLNTVLANVSNTTKHGTLSLYAVLDVKTGRVEGKTALDTITGIALYAGRPNGALITGYNSVYALERLFIPVPPQSNVPARFQDPPFRCRYRLRVAPSS